jgi:hypothetical protein
MLENKKGDKMKINKIKYCVIILAVLLICLQSVNALSYYNVSLDYKDGNFEIKNIGIISSEFDLNEKYGDYMIFVSDKDNTIVSNNLFQPPLYEIKEDYSTLNASLETDETVSEMNVLNETLFNVLIPYKEGKRITLYNKINNLELKSANIEDFLKIDNSDKGNGNLFLFVVLILIIIVLIVLLYFYVRN